ncbi:carotenoid biosynthesis protein [Candidatus Parcubacteria bacterium]|jgi:uncharacterized membrane protein|nr:carotenoid biosynthesis protein [Candidatus Parcubacteria bacterium]
MDINFYLVFEILGIAAFLLIFSRAIYQRNRQTVFELLAAFAFGLLLEIANIYLSHAYYYSDQFLFRIFDVPIVVGLCWAAIIYSAMLLSDQYRISWKIKPIFDAFTALVLDLSMDAVAIRLNFWHWKIPLNQEWYGVPFENLFGWIAVIFTFSFIIRFIRTLNPKRFLTKIFQCFSPLIAYGLLYLELTLFLILAIIPFQINYLGDWSHLLNLCFKHDIAIIYHPQVQFWKMIILIIIVIEMVNIMVYKVLKSKNIAQWHFDILSFSVLTSMHLLFMISLLVTKIYQTLPFLLFIAIFMFLVHLALHFLPLFLQKEKHIYFFRKISPQIIKTKKQIETIIESKLK